MERTSGFKIVRRVCGLLVVATALSMGNIAPAKAAERSLAGIQIFWSMNRVLGKYGTPSEVRIGGQSTDTSAGGTATGGGYPGAAGGGPGLPGFGGGSPAGGGYPGAGGGYPGAGGGMRGPFGASGDDSTGGGYPGATGSTLGVAIQSNMVTWIYDLPDGGSLEFTFSSDGRVIQIHATGLKGNERTSRGVMLGMKLKDVMDKYGFPVCLFFANRILHTSYIDKYHEEFKFYNQKLVGIIDAAVDIDPTSEVANTNKSPRRRRPSRLLAGWSRLAVRRFV